MSVGARQIVARNGYGDVIDVIDGRIEDVQLPEKVDSIVSEWMVRATQASVVSNAMVPAGFLSVARVDAVVGAVRA